VARERRRLDRVLFPGGAPHCPDAGEARYDRLDMAYAIGVLMANRDVVRRRLAEQESPDLRRRSRGNVG
jgi:hypothetical protein